MSFHRSFITRRFWLAAATYAGLAVVCSATRADTFGSGENTFEIEFVTIGDPGNPADTTGNPNPAGAVPYIFRIGKYEISEQMIRKANAATADSDNPLDITIDERGPNKPATRASWFEAARFVNWLNTSTGSSPAYKFNENNDFQLWEPTDAGYDADNLFRNLRARYFLPSANEWYKAAFYDPVIDEWFDFPNGSNDPPFPVPSGTAANTAVWNQGTGPADIMLAGGPSPFGTVAQAGNVWEWEETEFDLIVNDPSGVRGVRGSDFGLTITDIGMSSSFRNQSLPGNNWDNVGIRIASIPEPCTAWLFAFGLLVVLRGRNLAFAVRCCAVDA